MEWEKIKDTLSTYIKDNLTTDYIETLNKLLPWLDEYGTLNQISRNNIKTLKYQLRNHIINLKLKDRSLDDEEIKQRSIYNTAVESIPNILKDVNRNNVTTTINDVLSVYILRGLDNEYLDKFKVHLEQECDKLFTINIPVIKKYTKEEIEQFRNARRDKILGALNVLKLLPSVKYLDVDCTNGSITPIADYKRIQIIKARTGLGKTTTVKNYINENSLDIKSIAFLTAKKSLASWMDEYSNDNLNDRKVYNYMKDNIADKSNIIVQAESLWKVKGTYEVTVIDEITSFLEEMDSGLHGDKLDFNRDKLMMLLLSSRQVICLDANIGPKVWEFLHELFPYEKIHINYDTSKFTEQKIILFEDPPKDKRIKGYKGKAERHCWKKLIDLLKEGKNINVCLGSKNYGDKLITEILKHCPNIKYAYYNRDNHLSKHLQEGVKLTDLWKQYQLVMFTSTVGIGIDFNVPHFYAKFVFGQSLSLTIRELYQMMNRVRQTESNIIYMYNRIRKDYYPDTFEAVKNELIHKARLGDTVAASMLTREEYGSLVNFEGRFSYARASYNNNMWTRLKIQNLLDRYLCRNYFKELLEQMIEECGYELSYYDLKVDINYDISHKELKNINMEKTIKNLDTAQILSDEVLTELQRKLNKEGVPEEIIPSIDKTVYLKYIKPIHRKSINGKHLLYLKEHKTQIHQALMEKYLLPRQMLFKEFASNDMYMDKSYFLKYSCIVALCNILGLKHSRDRETLITDIKIKENFDNIMYYYPALKSIFQLKCVKPTDYRTMINMLNIVLNVWSGSELKNIKTKSTKRNLNNFYNSLIANYKGKTNTLNDVPQYLWLGDHNRICKSLKISNNEIPDPSENRDY